MLTLVNTNLMRPAIAPVGLDYVAAAARAAGIETHIIDLCLEGAKEDRRQADDASWQRPLQDHFGQRRPALVGVSFRNTDDSFWPSMQSFLPVLREVISSLRALTDAPVVLGGTGYSIFPRRVMEYTGADFGIVGDGEQAIVALTRELEGQGDFEKVPGLVWRVRDRRSQRSNLPAWPRIGSSDLPCFRDTRADSAAGMPAIPTSRDAVDNVAYLRLGGQVGLETKRGCNRRCIFCADPIAKGHALRLRSPGEVAEEVDALLRQHVDMLHLCDAEFNVPYEHALAVCQELTSRRLGERLRWYTYMAAVPFDAALARAMRSAGCIGINFTGPSASEAMLAAYRQAHRQSDLAAAARHCRDGGITSMLDLMLGGPGETPQTLRDGIEFAKAAGFDCVGAGLGVRLYPGLPMTDLVAAEAPLETNPGVRRRYEGPVDLLWPTFYISPALGEQPAALVREAIAGDQRFFEPADEDQTIGSCASSAAQRGYNYSDNDLLVRAVAAGARGAYWDILRRLRTEGLD